MNDLNIAEAAEILKKKDDVLIVFHKNPDGDAFGSATALFLGLKQLEKRCKIVSFSDIPDRFRFMFSNFSYDNLKTGFVVAVDLASDSLLDAELFNLKINLVIDHHKSNSVAADYCLVDEKAAATCELIFNLLKHLNVKISKQIAMNLYVGLATDTGCFKFSNTTSKTHEIAAKLITYGFDFAAINFNLFDLKTKNQLKLQSLVIQKLEFYFKVCCFVVVTRAMLLECCCDDSDFFIVSSVARNVSGVKFAVVLKQVSEFNFKVSVRTAGCYDACKFCEEFGGGGHIKAAGFEIAGGIQAVKARILNKVEEFVVKRGSLRG